ncbi:hypothetical protein cypCar_00038075 [Cyprinus carpio]|nr:hypothetical protein cypCar_00038075 [Cyprinus carpio]
MADEATRKAVSEIPLLKTNSGPRDKELWVQRLREEYLALIKYVENNKAADNDWFRLESNKEGTRGGKICLTDHFKPLWARNVPKFGLAHLMALGLGPWLAVEIPDLIAKGIIQHKEQQNS